MAFPPIDPVSDSRIQHKTAVLNGHTYHYLHGMPATGEVKATIFLVWFSMLFLILSSSLIRPICRWVKEEQSKIKSKWATRIADLICTSFLGTWLARSQSGVEISDPILTKHGMPGCSHGYDGLRRHGKPNTLFTCLMISQTPQQTCFHVVVADRGLHGVPAIDHYYMLRWNS